MKMTDKKWIVEVKAGSKHRPWVMAYYRFLDSKKDAVAFMKFVKVMYTVPLRVSSIIKIEKKDFSDDC
jgi:hypothetical protein